MKIADGIFMLEIKANIMGTTSTIHPALLVDNDKAILIDTGFPGQLSQIREAIEKEGITFSKLNTVILTHQDIDHVGTISDIQKELPNQVKVLAHETEKPYIEGTKQPIKLAQLKKNLDYLPENMKAMYPKLKAGFEQSRANVDHPLIDSEELPYCGGVKIIHTPGHTPGHICLYFNQHKMLIAGDLFQIKDGNLILAPESTNFDMELTKASLKKLYNFDIETVICYHGGIYRNGSNERIKEME